MKAPIVISVIFFIILGIAANYYVLKLSIMPFIGLMLIALVILGLIGNFAGKANKKRKGIRGEPDAFIFPDGTAKKLKKMDLGIQYETSVISSALLMLGIVIFLIYYVFFTQSAWVMKGLIIFNSLCGMGLMFGMLVTYYQQLVSYRDSTKFLRDFAATQPRAPQSPAFNGSMGRITPRQQPQQPVRQVQPRYTQPRQAPQRPRPQPQQPQYQEEFYDDYYAADPNINDNPNYRMKGGNKYNG